MMSLREYLADFEGAIGGAASYAPDDYPKQSYRTYESNVDDIKSLWARIRLTIQHDAASVAFVDLRLSEAFKAFDSGDKEKGQQAMWDIYNLGLRKLK